jgi:hypothetical protein
MKKIWLMGYILAWAGLAEAQQKGKTTPQKNVTQQRTILQNTNQQDGVNLTDTRSYPAKQGTNRPFSISDPVINAYNYRSNGGNIRLSGSGVLGSPRGTYGFANGQLLLRNTDATSFGGNSGNGSVGTGSSPAGPGTAGMVPWVNGKSVYAGPTIWGSGRGLNLPDSTLKKPVLRKAD